MIWKLNEFIKIDSFMNIQCITNCFISYETLWIKDSVIAKNEECNLKALKSFFENLPFIPSGSLVGCPCVEKSQKSCLYQISPKSSDKSLNVIFETLKTEIKRYRHLGDQLPKFHDPIRKNNIYHLYQTHWLKG